MSANLIYIILNSGNNLAASQRPRRQDSYQQAMGSLDPSTYPGSKPRRQDSYQQAMSSFDSQVCSFDTVILKSTIQNQVVNLVFFLSICKRPELCQNLNFLTLKSLFSMPENN